jgi:hypothetical protein
MGFFQTKERIFAGGIGTSVKQTNPFSRFSLSGKKPKTYLTCHAGNYFILQD